MIEDIKEFAGEILENIVYFFVGSFILLGIVLWQVAIWIFASIPIIIAIYIVAKLLGY